MAATFNFRQLAASTAVALAFAAPAQAHPLLDTTASARAYVSRLSNTIADAVKDDMARLRVRGFAAEFEQALREPSEQTRIVDYPKPAVVERLRITAVVPPKGLEMLDIPLCAEQNNKVVGTWTITPKGEVIPAPWTGQRQSETPTSAACKGFILAARADINSKVAQQANPPSQGAPPAAAAKPQ